MEHKNIDRLYQEKFKDFEVTPPDIVWNKIEEQLGHKKEKKRRIFPFWLKLSGVAALFLIGIVFYQKTNSSENEKIDKNEQKTVVLEDNHDIKNPQDSEKTRTENKIEGQNQREQNLVNIQKEEIEQQAEKKNSEKAIFRKGNPATFEQADKKLAETESQKSVFKEEDLSHFQKKNSESEFEENAKIAENKMQTQKDLKSNLEEKTENNSLLAVEDLQEKNAMEELLIEKGKEQENHPEEKKSNRWQVSTALAPVYFNSFTQNSPLDSQFDENTKEFESNVSYGVGVEYALNKKLSVRTGINRISMSQNTHDIVYYADLKGLEIKNVTPSENGAMMAVYGKQDASNDVVIAANDLNKSYGSLNQRVGFVEVPVELSYKFIDSKFGVKVIGGMSTLFLTENEIRIKSTGFTNEIGEANNLSNVHFSTNIGVGFDYKFWKSFSIGFEPMFKYQLNTLNKNNNNNFKPYFIGLYSGISYRF